MITRLSTDIVYKYIKNYCYDPVYDVVEITITSETDLTELPFQFASEVQYVLGAYVVKDGVLYIAVAQSKGPWAGDSIANIHTGEQIYSGERHVANVEDGDYDPDRFSPIAPLEGSDTLQICELLNPRTGRVKMAFDTVAHAREYLREYTESSDYGIHVEKISSNTYRATWDGNTMIFYD